MPAKADTVSSARPRTFGGARLRGTGGIAAGLLALASACAAPPVQPPPQDLGGPSLGDGCCALGPAPRLLRVEPAVGGVAGGDKVRLLGGGFAPGLSARFADSAVNTVLVSEGEARATVPQAAGCGRVPVAVSNPDRQGARLGGGFAYRCDQPAFQPGFFAMLGGAPLALALADTDGDGRQDLVVADPGERRVRVLGGDGAGGFGAPRDLPTAATGVAAADLNGDGLIDLAVAQGGDSVVGLWFGQPGGFRQGPTLPLPLRAQPVWLLATDLNGDGRADLASANLGTDTVSVLLATGGGGFAAAESYAVGQTPVNLVAGDLNGDGVVDLVALNATGHTATVLLGEGGGRLRATATVAAGRSPTAAALGDVDGDGRLDLAVASAGNDSVVLLQGGGDGTLRDLTTVPLKAPPTALALWDVTSDDVPDLLVLSGGTLLVFRSLGGGRFDAPLALAAPEGAPALGVADLDGDTLPDAVAVGPRGSLQVLRNRSK